MQKEISIEVYGTEVICASCVNAPSSIDTYEWLEAAISRKYKDQPFSITYIDIEKPVSLDHQKIMHNVYWTMNSFIRWCWSKEKWLVKAMSN